jgi:hypothetical protein
LENFMALGNLRNNNAAAQNNGPRTPSKSIVFKVETFEGTGEPDSPLTMVGTASMGNELVKEGEQITVVMQERFNKDRTSALTRFCGSAPGSIIMLDGCYRNQDGNISSNWANAIISQKERVGDPKSYHNRRGVLSFISEVPTLRVPNVNRGEGEPAFIHWQLNQDEMTIGNVTRDRAWLKKKVEESELSKVRVHFDTFEPEHSVLVSSYEEMSNIISELVTEGRSALIRAFDEEGVVMTRKAMANADNNPQETLDFLSDRGIFSGVNNEELFQYIASGEGQMEIIPMDRRYYVSDSKQSVVSGFTGGRAKQMIGAFGMGDNTAQLAAVYLPFQAQNQGQEDEWIMPIGPMGRAGDFAGDFKAMTSPHYTPVSEAAPTKTVDQDAQAEAPAAAAPAQAAQAAPAADVGSQIDAEMSMDDDVDFETPGIDDFETPALSK